MVSQNQMKLSKPQDLIGTIVIYKNDTIYKYNADRTPPGKQPGIIVDAWTNKEGDLFADVTIFTMIGPGYLYGKKHGPAIDQWQFMFEASDNKITMEQEPDSVTINDSQNTVKLVNKKTKHNKSHKENIVQ